MYKKISKIEMTLAMALIFLFFGVDIIRVLSSILGSIILSSF